MFLLWFINDLNYIETETSALSSGLRANQSPPPIKPVLALKKTLSKAHYLAAHS